MNYFSSLLFPFFLEKLHPDLIMKEPAHDSRLPKNWIGAGAVADSAVLNTKAGRSVNIRAGR